MKYQLTTVNLKGSYKPVSRGETWIPGTVNPKSAIFHGIIRVNYGPQADHFFLYLNTQHLCARWHLNRHRVSYNNWKLPNCHKGIHSAKSVSLNLSSSAFPLAYSSELFARLRNAGMSSVKPRGRPQC